MRTGVRATAAIVTAVVVVVLLFGWVFPWVERTFVTDPVVHSPTS